jgi:hypothetical protein
MRGAPCGAHRWSTVRPATCSGDMYGTVPMTTPSRVWASVGSSELEPCGGDPVVGQGLADQGALPTVLPV